MEYRFKKELNPNCLLMENQSGQSVIFDKAGLVMQMRESLRMEQQKELKAIIQKEEPVTHKNLLKYSSLEKYDGELYLVRDDDKVRELSRVVTIGLEEACRVLVTILEIMRVYHQQGVSLGGLSLGQLKKNGPGEIYLQDPPVMNHLNKSLEPLYRIDLPREVIKGQSWSEASDVFSWGELAYRLLCGEDAFLSETPEERIGKIIQTNIIAPKDVQPKLSAELNQLVIDCLNRLPEERPMVADLIEKMSLMLKEGSYRVSDQAAREYSNKAISNVKKYVMMERFQIWFRKYGVVTCVAVGLVLLFVTVTIFTKSKRTLTINTPSWKVVDYYYQGIQTLNTLLLDETLYKVKKSNSLADIITNLFVLNKVQQGMTYSSKDFITTSFPELKIELLEQHKTLAKYRAIFTLKITLERQIRYIQRTEEMTLRPVNKIWRITDIKVIKDKQWEEPNPTPSASPFPGGKGN
jgi:serine/threonine protein kinase